MLGPHWEGRTRPSTTAATIVDRFVYGGVEISLRHESASSDVLPAPRFIAAPGTADPVGRVEVQLRVERALSRPGSDPPNALRCTQAGARLELESDLVRITLDALGAGHYRASALVADGPAGAAALVRAVSATILRLEGGATLHAAAVAIGAGAVAYLGPSGAGKSTAVALTDGARCLAEDHLALVPTPEGWHAWALPGGTPSGVATTPNPVLPLRGLLRVRRGRDAPRLTPVHGAAALFAVREAVESDDCSVAAEAARLAVADRISREVTVATIHTVPGRPIGDLVEGWIGAHAARHGEPA